MSSTDLLLAAVTTVVGALVGLAISYYFFRRGAPRPKVVVALHERAHIDPSTVGVHVQMKVGTTEIANLLLLEVVVSNRGPGDLVVDDATDTAKHPLRPRIDLPENVRALADPWNPDGSSATADVRLARRLHDGHQELYVHIHRLARGAMSRARIVCTYQEATPGPPVTPQGIGFYPGFLPDVDIQGAGLLAGSTLLRR